MKICTLGDLLLDVIVRLDRPLVAGDDVFASSRTAPGGQAANVAAWAAALGADAAFVGRRGDDEAGGLVTAALGAYGVSVLGPAEGRNGIVVSLVDPDGTRSMASDRGVAPDLAPADLDAAWFACNWLHVAGYSLLRDPIAQAALAAISWARAAGALVSVDLSTSTAIEDYGSERFRSLLEVAEPDLLFGTATELEALGGRFPSRHWVLKRGAEGITIGRSDGAQELPALATDVVDSTGAGDALAAGYLVGGPSLALEAAARCVGKLGAMP